MTDLDSVFYTIELPFTRDPEDPFQLKGYLIKEDVQNKDKVAQDLMKLFQATVENSPRLSWLLSGWDSLEERLKEFPESGRLISICIALSKPWCLPEFQDKVKAFPSLEPNYAEFARCIAKLPLLFWLTYKVKERGEPFQLLLETLVNSAEVSIADLAIVCFGRSAWRTELGSVGGLSDRTIACRLWSTLFASQSFCIFERLQQTDALRDTFSGTSLSLVSVIRELLPVSTKDWNTVVKNLPTKPTASFVDGEVKVIRLQVCRDDGKDAV